MNGYVFYRDNIIAIFTNKHFKGWGRKKTGRFASWCHTQFGGKLTLYEDGFIRSLGLGIHGFYSLSTIEDKRGIYYDSTATSDLEYILNTYDFNSNNALLQKAYEAIKLMRENHISKYNYAPDISEEILNKIANKKSFNEDVKNNRILVVAQTLDDESLKYGLAGHISTDQIIKDAIDENPEASIYLKIHPDVLTGKKKSDINMNNIPENCTVIDKDVNPISLLKLFDIVYTKTSGMGMEALILNKKVVCYGIPYYAGWGLTEDRQYCNRRIRKLSIDELFAGAYILYPKYHAPFSKKDMNILDTIYNIIKYRDFYRQNTGNLYFFGFSVWKRGFTAAFFTTLKKNNIIFCTTLQDAINKDIDEDSKIFVWGKKQFTEVETYAKEQNIALFRIEDGFVRSVSLGSDLTKAYSLVIDSRGIYFDPTKESDLEHLLNTYEFDDGLLQRAKKLQSTLRKNKLSKYNIYQDKKLKLQKFKENKTVILVPGQVEDDASVIYGANGMTNLELLQKVRIHSPDAYIIYKPHPDVIVGNRIGNIETTIALQYCNIIIEKESIDSVLEIVDEVHTMTSLVGFEALIREKKVYTYGLPFYACWGLTIDRQFIDRRNTKRTLEELIAATLILYPRYIHPKTNEFCEVEILLEEIEEEKKKYHNNILYKMSMYTRNFILRKIRQFYS